MNDLQRRVLNALVAAGGQITVAELKKLYLVRGDGQRQSTLVRYGLTEWVREENKLPAFALRITDAGRQAVNNGE